MTQLTGVEPSMAMVATPELRQQLSQRAGQLVNMSLELGRVGRWRAWKGN